MEDTLPQRNWHQRQVAIWAQKVLNLDEKSAKILAEQRITGNQLLLIPSAEKLESWCILCSDRKNEEVSRGTR
jgi:hypothetical protein